MNRCLETALLPHTLAQPMAYDGADIDNVNSTVHHQRVPQWDRARLFWVLASVTGLLARFLYHHFSARKAYTHLVGRNAFPTCNVPTVRN